VQLSHPTRGFSFHESVSSFSSFLHLNPTYLTLSESSRCQTLFLLHHFCTLARLTGILWYSHSRTQLVLALWYSFSLTFLCTGILPYSHWHSPVLVLSHPLLLAFSPSLTLLPYLHSLKLLLYSRSLALLSQHSLVLTLLSLALLSYFAVLCFGGRVTSILEYNNAN